MVEYSYCEPVWAAPLASWCIRPLTDAGRKLGGGVDTESLCGRVSVEQGWDLPYPVEADKPGICKICEKLWTAETRCIRSSSLSRRASHGESQNSEGES